MRGTYPGDATSLCVIGVFHEQLSIGKHVGSHVGHVRHVGHAILGVGAKNLGRLAHQWRAGAGHLKAHVVHSWGAGAADEVGMRG